MAMEFSICAPPIGPSTDMAPVGKLTAQIFFKLGICPALQQLRQGILITNMP